MTRKPDEVERVATRTAHGERVVAFGREADALVERGVAVAFGGGRCARVDGPSGCAVSFGGGVAQGQTAVSLLSSGGTAQASRIAVALNHAGVAVGSEVAFADNLDSQAHSGKLAIATGPRGTADGLMAIALGREGRAVARAGGTIALAFYDQHPGHWETPHGCDPCWIDGDHFLSGLKVAKVGENDIRADHIYQLDPDGRFVEVGPAGEARRCADT